MRRSALARLLLALVPLVATAARADEDPAAYAPAPAPYSLPWQLRSAVAVTSLRSDTSFASYENAATSRGLSIATLLTATYKIPGTGARGAGLAPLLRLTAINDSPPAGTGGFAVVNPLVGASYASALGSGFRVSAFLGLTIPIGMGGGDSPDAGALEARSKGQYARAAMDNALFAVNDLSVIPGIDLAWVGEGLTLQIEATLFQLERVRGAKAQAEGAKTNFTSGLHVGYFVLPWLSLGAEIRYQRWIDGPLLVHNDKTGTLVDNLTFALGPRLHVPLGDGIWLRPGIAFSRGIDAPMAASPPDYDIVQVDVPVVF